MTICFVAYVLVAFIIARYAIRMYLKESKKLNWNYSFAVHTGWIALIILGCVLWLPIGVCLTFWGLDSAILDWLDNQ